MPWQLVVNSWLGVRNGRLDTLRSSELCCLVTVFIAQKNIVIKADMVRRPRFYRGEERAGQALLEMIGREDMRDYEVTVGKGSP